MTVAFSGNADPAYVAIREARRALYGSGPRAAVDVLKQASQDGHIDFIVAVHAAEASLVRLRRGVPLDVPDLCALGDEGPFRALIDEARARPEVGPLRLGKLRLGLIDKLLKNKDLGPSIGGFPISVEATTSGHRYVHVTGAYTYKMPEGMWGRETHQSIEQVYTGDGHFTLSVVPGELADVPVVGACLLQARKGYVYSPMEQPCAFQVALSAPELRWEGHEHEMYSVLNRAIASHSGKLASARVL